MRKKLVLVASPPACGKTYISKLIAKQIGGIVYLDKDDLAPIVRRAFNLASEPLNMDGEFYVNNIRQVEYETILNIAFSTLEFNDFVLLNAPFGKEIRDNNFIRSLKEKANKLNSDLILIWVYAPKEVVYERMKKRASDRDLLKIKKWQEYSSKINYSCPTELIKNQAVTRLITFDSTDDSTTEKSLKETLEILTKSEQL